MGLYQFFKLLFLYLVANLITYKKKVINDKIQQDIDNMPISEVEVQNDIYRTMYVNASAGLRIRNYPDLNSDRIGVLDFGKMLFVTKGEPAIINIDGVDGQWVYVITEDIQGWVFDAYLSDIDIEAFIIGHWNLQKNSWYTFCFSQDGRYGERMDSWAVGGSWQINRNVLILTRNEIEGNSGEGSVITPMDEIVLNFSISINGEDNMILNLINTDLINELFHQFDDGKIILVRW